MIGLLIIGAFFVHGLWRGYDVVIAIVYVFANAANIFYLLVVAAVVLACIVALARFLNGKESAAQLTEKLFNGDDDPNEPARWVP